MFDVATALGLDLTCPNKYPILLGSVQLQLTLVFDFDQLKGSTLSRGWSTCLVEADVSTPYGKGSACKGVCLLDQTPKAHRLCTVGIDLGACLGASKLRHYPLGNLRDRDR